MLWSSGKAAAELACDFISSEGRDIGRKRELAANPAKKKRAAVARKLKLLLKSCCFELEVLDPEEVTARIRLPTKAIEVSKVGRRKFYSHKSIIKLINKNKQK